MFLDLFSQSLEYFFVLVDIKEEHCEIVGSCICSCDKKSLYLVNQSLVSNLSLLIWIIFLLLDVLKNELNNCFRLCSFLLFFGIHFFPGFLYISSQNIVNLLIKG